MLYLLRLELIAVIAFLLKAKTALKTVMADLRKRESVFTYLSLNYI